MGLDMSPIINVAITLSKMMLQPPVAIPSIPSALRMVPSIRRLCGSESASAIGIPRELYRPNHWGFGSTKSLVIAGFQPPLSALWLQVKHFQALTDGPVIAGVMIVGVLHFLQRRNSEEPPQTPHRMSETFGGSAPPAPHDGQENAQLPSSSISEP